MTATRLARRLGACASALLLLLAGCAAAPAPIQHVVLVKLANPADAAGLLADCRAQLPGIPGVASCAIGQPLDTGRSSVDGDYDAALVLGFASTADYQRYLEHPAHVALVEAWKPRWLWIRIHDFAPPLRPESRGGIRLPILGIGRCVAFGSACPTTVDVRRTPPRLSWLTRGHTRLPAG